MATTQECCKKYWTSPGGNTPQSSSCTATYHPSRKLFKLDEPDMLDTAGEVGTSSSVMYSYGPLHMAEQKQGDQLESTYSSSVRILGVALRTCQKLWTILNKSWRQHSKRHELYGHLPPITKTIQVRRTRHARHCWRSRDELISDVLLWTPSHGRAKAGRPARIYIQQLCEDTGCSPEDLPEAMNDREEWRERVRDIHADGMTRWDDDEMTQ